MSERSRSGALPVRQCDPRLLVSAFLVGRALFWVVRGVATIMSGADVVTADNVGRTAATRWRVPE